MASRMRIAMDEMTTAFAVLLPTPSAPPRLHGSGMIVVNPPFTLESELQVLLPALAALLGDSGRGRARLDWLRGD